MVFLDRDKELARLRRLHQIQSSGLVVVWGRRRIGKTRLLLEWMKSEPGVYFVADESPPNLQRNYFAEAVSRVFERFDEVEYPDWRSLFRRITSEAEKYSWKGVIVIDEFPYLAQSDSSLVSVLQNWIDNELVNTGIILVLSGSSQRMMQGLVLNHTAPLYGRALEILKLAPVPLRFLNKALTLSEPLDIIKAYAHWGGIPRYWELASLYSVNLEAAVNAIILDPMGPLHDECERLLREDNLSSQTLRPILDVVGNGAHRLSEIGGRLGLPATSMTRPIKLLDELGYLRRELPYGDSAKSSKRSLYKIADPFLNLWTQVVAPNRSALRQIPEASRIELWKKKITGIYAELWEELCREFVPFFDYRGPWQNAGRYWHGKSPEFDVVCESLDAKRLLVGEVKWSEEPFSEDRIKAIAAGLKAKGTPQLKNKKEWELVYTIFVPLVENPVPDFYEGVKIVTASDVVELL